MLKKKCLQGAKSPALRFPLHPRIHPLWAEVQSPILGVFPATASTPSHTHTHHCRVLRILQLRCTGEEEFAMWRKHTRFFLYKGKSGGGWWISDLTSIIDQPGAESSVGGRTAVIFRVIKILKLGDYLLGAVYIRNKYSNTLRSVKVTVEIISNPDKIMIRLKSDTDFEGTG